MRNHKATSMMQHRIRRGQAADPSATIRRLFRSTRNFGSERRLAETGCCWAARQEHLALVRRYRAPVSATEGAASSGAGLPSGAGGAAAARDESDRLRSTLATEGTRASLVSFAFALLETADFQCLRRAQGRCVGGAESSSTSSGVERGCAEPRYARIRCRSAERARAAREPNITSSASTPS